MDRLWRSNSSISPRTGCPLDIENDEDHKVESCGATMCLHGTKSKIFKNNTLSMANASLNDHACFNYYSNAYGLKIVRIVYIYIYIYIFMEIIQIYSNPGYFFSTTSET